MRSPRGIRIGKTLLLPVADVTHLATHGHSTNSEWFIGPRLRAALDQITAVRRSNQHVLVTGGTRSGKELAACVFHDLSPKSRDGRIAVLQADFDDGADPDAERQAFLVALYFSAARDRRDRSTHNPCGCANGRNR